MITYPQALLASGGAHSGIAPCNLFDILSVEGQLFYWGDRAIKNLMPAFTISAAPDTNGLYYPVTPSAPVNYSPWTESVQEISNSRSLATDTMTFVVQNLSGDSMQRDFERQARQSALEGAFVVYRMWQADAAASWFEFHGTMSVADITDRQVEIKVQSLLDASETDAMPFLYGETCPLDWASLRCGATGVTPCQNSFASCQVVERFMGVMNSFEKNYGEATASTSTNVINRRRQI